VYQSLGVAFDVSGIVSRSTSTPCYCGALSCPSPPSTTPIDADPLVSSSSPSTSSSSSSSSSSCCHRYLFQIEREARANVEKAQRALDELRAKESSLVAKIERVQQSQLLMMQKKREVAKLSEELEVWRVFAGFGTLSPPLCCVQRREQCC
jgi:hypothetical protein